jgi:hypothetical protein
MIILPLLYGTGIAQSVQELGYGLKNQAIGIRFLAGVRDFLFPHSVQTHSRAYPASYPMGTGTWVNQRGHETEHSPPSSTEVKNGGSIPPLPHISSWHGA